MAGSARGKCPAGISARSISLKPPTISPQAIIAALTTVPAATVIPALAAVRSAERRRRLRLLFGFFRDNLDLVDLRRQAGRGV